MKKNKSLHILILAFVLVSLVVLINLDKIKFGLSMLDIYNKSKVETDTETQPKGEVVDNPLEKLLDEEEPVDSIVDNSDEKVEENKEQLSENKKTNEDAPKNTQEDKGRSLQNIVVEYNDKLLTLQTEFDGELNKLIDTAIKDYNSGVSKVKLATKYLSEGTKLEKSSDEKFYSLLYKMEKELVDNSLDTQVSKDVAKYYETFKKGKKTALINKGMNIVKE